MSPERLRHLAATIAERATARRVRTAGQVLLVAGIIFVVLRVGSLWHGSHIQFGRIDWLTLTTAAAAAFLAVLAAAFVWLHILRRFGVKPRTRWVGIYMQAQLGKYIPGSVWQYLGRAALARSEAIPVRLAAASLTVELAACVVAAGALGTLAGGTLACAVTLGAILATFALWVVARRRLGPLRRLRAPRGTARATVDATVLYLPIWLLLGLSFWLTARSLFHVNFGESGFYTGVWWPGWWAWLSCSLPAVLASGKQSWLRCFDPIRARRTRSC